jgi:hypothetical protein
MKIDTTELYESIATLERLSMERDDNVAQLFDNAELEDSRHDDWRQRQDDEREFRLNEALDAAKVAGVEAEHLKVLAFETGATHWALKNSLKG